GGGIGAGLKKTRGVQPAPGSGSTYAPSAQQTLITRGGAGIFYDRAQGNTVFDLIGTPPATIQPTLNYGRLQEIDPNNLLLAPPALVAFDHEGKVPTTYAFNAGMQVNLPLESVLDVSYVGSLSRNQLQRRNITA